MTRNDRSTYILTIEGVSTADEGFYMCQVNSEPMLQEMAFLRIVSSPSISDSETTKDLSIMENENARITCVANGKPAPSITWKINGNIKDKIQNKSMIVLHNITRNDMGTLMCIARNGVPPARSKTIKLYVNFFPEVTVEDDVIGSSKGSFVTLKCTIQAYPIPIVYWTTPLGNVVTNNNNISVEHKILDTFTFSSTLNIQVSSNQYFGKYTCSAKNTVGKDSKLIKLYEIRKQFKKKSTSISPVTISSTTSSAIKKLENEENTSNCGRPINLNLYTTIFLAFKIW